MREHAATFAFAALLATAAGYAACNAISGVEGFQVTGGAGGASTTGTMMHLDGGGGGGAAPAGWKVPWAKGLGAAGMTTKATGIALGSTGDVLVSGLLDVSAGFGGGFSGSSDGAFLVTMSPSKGATIGADSWPVGIAVATNGTAGTSVAALPGGGAAVAGFVQKGAMVGSKTLPAGGVFVAVLDASGTVSWSNAYGTAMTFDQPLVAAGPNGGVYLFVEGEGQSASGAITFDKTYMADTSSFQSYLAQIDATGTPVWSHVFDNTFGSVYAGGLASDDTGVYVGGKIDTGAVDFGCTSGPLDAGSPYSFYVAKLDTTGKCLWNRAPGGNTPLKGLAVDAQHAVYVTGVATDAFSLDAVTVGHTGPSGVSGTYDAYVLKLHADGSAAWGANYGDAGQQYADCIAVSAGGVVVAGRFAGTLAFGKTKLLSSDPFDVFAASFDPATGAPTKAGSFVTTTQDPSAVVSCAVDAAGSAFLAGTFQGAIGFHGPLDALGDADGFVARLE